MPTYEYQCDACGHRFEKFQSIKAAAIRKCPKCGKNKVRRLLSAGAGFIFKGSGFYITDYRDKSYTDKAKAESAAATPAKETTEAAKPAATDAKPAEKKTESAPPKTEPKPEPKSASKSAAKQSKKSKS